MIGLEVSLNDERLCLAAIEDLGTFDAGVRFTRIPQQAARGSSGHVSLSVAGLVNDEHLRWHSAEVKPGDEVHIKVVETQTFDSPSSRTSVEEHRREMRAMWARQGRPFTEENYGLLLADVRRLSTALEEIASADADGRDVVAIARTAIGAAGEPDAR